MSCLESFKRLDLFGSQVKLGVTREQKTHKTALGAGVSLVYIAAICWIVVQFTGQSAQNLKFPDSWAADLDKAEALEAKVAAKVKADANKVKADADKLKDHTRRLLAASGQLATETVYSQYPFAIDKSQ